MGLNRRKKGAKETIFKDRDRDREREREREREKERERESYRSE